MTRKEEVADEGGSTRANSVDEKFPFHPDPLLIARLRRKIDLHMIPLLALLYLCSFLDRVNIANAKLAGMDAHLNLTPTEYSWALSIFFIGYVIAEVPSNIMLKRFGPKRWITLVMLVWGGITMLLSVCKNAAGLYATRFFLGLFEAGLFPGTVFIISLWYTRGEQALRNGLFFSTASIAGAFGGVLGYGLAKLDGRGGLHGWQWIFIIEGLITIVVAIATYFLLPDFPGKARFLDDDMKELAEKRMTADAGPATEKHFSWRQFWMVYGDWKTYMHAIPYFLTMAPLYSLALFIPSIVKGFNYDALTSQLMSAPCYAIACIFTILAAISSDRFRERGLHYAIPCLFGIVGYVLLIVTKEHSATVRYVCLTITVSSVFAAIPAMVAWVSGSFGGHTKRAVATATIIGFGNSSGIVSGFMYPAKDAPHYVRGHTICVVMLSVAVVFILTLKTLYIRENRRRDRLSPEEYAKESQGEELCDRHPDYRFIA
ncbi:hypothetical protein BGW41_000509 [Actinomortierella wolfii]|nr:hypothetical protein BGW41_000509 [Actinomortierella wolfii]